VPDSGVQDAAVRPQKRPYFVPDLFSFLNELRRHNNRDWFEQNKPRYEAVVKDPVLQFIADIGPRLAKISPHFVADPRPIGGSMMRIYRDIRFSKDKTPYKKSIGIHFWHQTQNDKAGPAFYLHLEPSGCVCGGGVWRPESAALNDIRDAIAADGSNWARAAGGRRFRSDFSFAGESLKQAPRGYASDHPSIEDIKRRDFAVSAPLADEEVISADFMNTLLGAYDAIAPFMRFLSEALKLPF
jgi:uncharacterized protein (TIGR02453 family)